MWKHIFFVCALCVLTSCEKAVLPDDEKTNKTEKTDTASTNKTNPADTTTQSGNGQNGTKPNTEYISVDSAIALPSGTRVEFLGYIVGSCTKSISNANFSVPTDYSQCILMADDVNETNPEHLIAVKLTDRTKPRNALNLKEHPDFLHHRVIITAYRVNYLHIAGVEKVDDYQF